TPASPRHAARSTVEAVSGRAGPTHRGKCCLPSCRRRAARAGGAIGQAGGADIVERAAGACRGAYGPAKAGPYFQRGKAAASTALPQPPRTSQNVPMNSADSFANMAPLLGVIGQGAGTLVPAS